MTSARTVCRIALAAAFLELAGAAVTYHTQAAETPGHPDGEDARTDCYGDPLPLGAITRLGTVRWRAAGIGRMAFVAGGKLLATADGSVLSVWDVETGRVTRTISMDGAAPGDGFAYGLALTPDGKRLLSAGQVGGRARGFRGEKKSFRLLLWDFSSGKLLMQSPDVRGEGRCFAIRPDGRFAACATALGDVLLWDLTKNMTHSVGGAASIHSLSFAEDGKHLVVLPSEGSVSMRISVRSRAIVKLTELGSCARVALAPNNGTIATYSDPDRLSLYDTATGEKRRLPLKEKVDYLDLSFSTDGHTLLAMDRRAEVVQFWDVAKGRLRRRLHVPGLARTHEHAQLLLSGDGEKLASHAGNRVVRLWDAGTGRPCVRLPAHVCPPIRVEFSTDGKEVISYAHRDGSFGGELCRWDTATGKLVAVVSPDAPEETLSGALADWRLAPGGRHLAERDGGAIYLYGGRTGRRLLRTDEAPPDSDWAFTPDGRCLVTVGADQGIRLWHVTTGKIQHRLELEKKAEPISWLRFTPDGKTLVTGEGYEKVHLWDASTGKHRSTLTLPEEQEPFQKPLDKWETALSPDGRYLFTSNTMSLWVWDLAARRAVGPFEADKYEWRIAVSGQVAVSPDGRLLAWFDAARKLRLYEVATGKIVHRFAENYSSVAFAPSGWRLATGCNADSSVLIWDLSCLFHLQPLPGKDTSPEMLWAFLGAGSAMQAQRALWRLAALPEVDAFLARRLSPVKDMPPERLRALLAALASAEFAAREEAEKTLGASGEAVAAALAEAAAQTKDAEVRRRVARLQERLQPRSPERLREVRAVQVLEARDTPETRRLLRELAGGNPEARLTREAGAALERLARRPAPVP